MHIKLDKEPEAWPSITFQEFNITNLKFWS